MILRIVPWIVQGVLSWIIGSPPRPTKRIAIVDPPCEMCAGQSRYLCVECREPIRTHTHENDFLCETHSFVNVIRERDGAILAGDGVCGVSRVIGSVLTFERGAFVLTDNGMKWEPEA